MSELNIEVQKREKTGKGANRRARSGGLILSLIHISEPRDRQKSRMPSSA